MTREEAWRKHFKNKELFFRALLIFLSFLQKEEKSRPKWEFVSLFYIFNLEKAI